jgi:hypothetical protein
MAEEIDLYDITERGDPSEIQAIITADPTCVKKLLM